ncbi:MAG: RIP metalloprotease RseP [Akkermansiaceae bacterium]
MGEFFYSALLIFVVVMLFNFIIFWHELGHFLAARWRGVKVDRFQIWFGKPIWKKTINGVQYGLGWLPFGGFVALPQMAPMESIEGENRDREPLPKIKPIDKMIVAFAGPLFSLILALLASLLVWNVGKPLDAIETTVIGAVMKNEPAEKAGMKAGDKILKVNGEPVKWFAGDFDAVTERIMFTEGDKVHFEVERDGEILEFTSSFEIEERSWFRRRALPRVGIAAQTPTIIGRLIPSENMSPAERAGLKPGDEILEVNSVKVYGYHQVGQLIEANGDQASTFKVKRGEEILEKTILPLVPISPKWTTEKAMIGIQWGGPDRVSTQLVYPSPLEQITRSAKMMYRTLKVVASPSSNVGIDQLAGPVGIGKMKYQLLQTEQGWLRVLFFFVFFNMNLAILNMLPFPVLDGSHITLAIGEMIKGSPPKGKVLEVVQTFFALTLITFMLFITTKDIGDSVPTGGGGESKNEKYVWPDPAG